MAAAAERAVSPVADIARVKSADRPERASLRMRLRHFDLSLLLFAAVGLVLAMLVLNPLVRLTLLGFSSDQAGGLTLENYLAAYTNPQHLEALGNSVALGIAVSVLCVLFAVPIAWA